MHDETWLQDVEMLIRRLEGKDVVRSRRRLIPLAIGLVVIGVVTAVAWPRANDPNTDDEITDCPEPDESWTPIEVPSEATAVDHPDDVRTLRYTVVNAYSKAEPGKWLVVLEMKVDNETEEIAGTNGDHTGYGPSNFDALHVNRASVGAPFCNGTKLGDPDLSPGEVPLSGSATRRP